MKPSRELFLERKQSRRLGVDVREASRWPRGREACPTHLGAPPPSWAPCCSTDVLLPPIYTYVPPNYQIRSQKPNSTAAAFCTREILSWGLFRSSTGGASITEGFYINTIASPMMCEQFTTDLRVHSYQLDGFFSLSSDLNTKFSSIFLEIYSM